MRKYKLILDDKQTAIITIRNKRESGIVSVINWSIERLNALEKTDEKKQYYRNELQKCIDVMYIMGIIDNCITALVADNASLVDNASLTALYK